MGRNKATKPQPKPQSGDDYSMARMMVHGGLDAAPVMKTLNNRSDSELAAVRRMVAALQSDVAALQAIVAELRPELRQPDTCPSPVYYPVSPSPGLCGSDDDNADSDVMHPVFGRYLTNKELKEIDWGKYPLGDDNADSGHMHPVIGRMLTNAEYRDYDKICEYWKDDIEASKEWFAEQRAASESPIDSDDDEVEPPKKKARADDTEAITLRSEN